MARTCPAVTVDVHKLSRINWFDRPGRPHRLVAMDFPGRRRLRRPEKRPDASEPLPLGDKLLAAVIFALGVALLYRTWLLVE